MADVPLKVSWPSGSTTIHSKAEQPFAAYNYDYPMSSSLNEFSIWVNDGAPTDKVSGIGMGAGGNPSIHTSTWIDWQWVQMPEIVWPPEPEPPTPTPIRDRLIWPVVGPVTQFFGSHGITYAGAPGHDGIDFAVVTGTPVKAVADGIVKWVGFDRDGFGQYIRIFHPGHGFHSFMGHLSQVIVAVGQTVKQGQTVALSGSTGNSTGPHLHFSTRIGEEDDYYELHDGYSNGAANPLAVYGLINRVDPNSTLMSRG
jgi:murein DD-endopeptidase MepM/ murein hydrolase activator NlpD